MSESVPPPLIEEPPPVLYHYTRQVGLLGIIRDGRLWASQVHYLNDSEEFQYAWRLLYEELDSHATGGAFGELLSVERQLKHRVCVTSFTSRDDDLSQWRAYGAVGDAYAIGFTVEEILAVAGAYGGSAVKCLYDPPAQRTEIKKLTDHYLPQFDALYEHVGGNLKPHLDDALNIVEAFMREFFVLAAIIKHPAFRAEDEWRLVFPPPHGNLELKFRTARHFLVPYLELDWLAIGQGHPIEEIVVGPGDHGDLAEAAVRALAFERKLFLAKVRQSKVPYRG